MKIAALPSFISLLLLSFGGIDVETNGSNETSEIILQHMGYDTVFQGEIMSHIYSDSTAVGDKEEYESQF